ncbi:hypothetical protein [Thermomonospora cellulosilytica]|uniref:Uncharacterized protein n=1 Tax=Thermomonospora cellulosilytica TaxID=1411118 RepID=A0A7W3RAQ7_9ACTN|nr:hypothetical protein [Thermomonospora cellulosilytica]MBA9005954.1 hypothetical protein [Thermomonospora cellulosilytica]
MACSCSQRNRTQYEVVTPDGAVKLTSPSKPAADAVAKRYPGAVVREKGKTTPAAQPARPTATS